MDKKFISMKTIHELSLKDIEDIKKNLSNVKGFNFVLVDARVNLA